MKKKHLLIGLVLGAMLLTGCGSRLDSITENTMTIEKDGTITDISVEDFSEGDYDMADLESFVNSEVADYNADAGEERIVLEAFDTENKLAKLELSYTDMEDYNSFNHTTYELCGMGETTISGNFTSVADGSEVKASEITDSDAKILKVADAMNISCKGKVLYYNEYVTEENGTFTASGEGVAVIVFK